MMDNTKINEIKSQFISLIKEDMAEYMLGAYDIDANQFNIDSVMKSITTSDNWGNWSSDNIEYNDEISLKKWTWEPDYGPNLFSTNNKVSENDIIDYFNQAKDIGEKEYRAGNKILAYFYNDNKNFIPIKYDEDCDEDAYVDENTGEILHKLCFYDTFRVEILLDKDDNPFCYEIIQD